MAQVFHESGPGEAVVYRAGIQSGINAVIVVLPVVIADPEIEGEIANHFLEIYNGFQRGQFEKIVKGNAVISDQKDVVLYDCSRVSGKPFPSKGG